jgi:DNA-directed RNA polymerase I subunit RPA2
VNLSSGETQVVTKKDLLQMPLMVMSSKCHLRGLSPNELVARKEDHFEIGGYFIASGNEKVIRLLNMNRKRFAILLNFFQIKCYFTLAGIMAN